MPLTRAFLVHGNAARATTVASILTDGLGVSSVIAVDGFQALQQALSRDPDPRLVVIDAALVRGGRRMVSGLRHPFPQLILISTTAAADWHQSLELLSLGVHGVVCETMPPPALIHGLSLALAGHAFFPAISLPDPRPAAPGWTASKAAGPYHRRNAATVKPAGLEGLPG